MRHFCKWGFQWFYNEDGTIHAVIIPVQDKKPWRVMREDQRGNDPAEFPTFAEAWFFAKETE